jgi:hypothetical protein
MFQRLTTNIQDGSRLGKVKAGSNPEAEYEETLAKAVGFLAALKFELPGALVPQEFGTPKVELNDSI